MSTSGTVTRRDFLRSGAVAGAGLVIAIYLPGCSRRDAPAAAGDTASDSPFAPNAFLRIGADDSVTVIVGYSEMGQGVATSIPMLVAEELDADWSKVTMEFAPADKAYANPLFGAQGTGGSTAVRGAWKPMSVAGAAAREMLVAAAAATWGVSATSCQTKNGTVTHSSGKSLRYGQLVAKAATLPVPQSPALKDPKNRWLVGTPRKRLDSPAKTNGAAKFGIDTRLPGMLVATVARCPVFGGKLVRFDDTKAKAIPGVKRVVPLSSGVAILAEGFWPAKQGREVLAVTWDEGAAAGASSESISRELARAVRQKGAVARHDGAGEAALGRGRRVNAVYEVPFLAHATMEPMNCTADVRADGCDVWVPTQFQSKAQGTAAAITGLPPEKVKVHTTFLGGGFGRRSEADFVAEAVEASKAAGAPVKVVWTREDDIRHDFYRPATYNVLSASLGDDGMPIAYSHHVAGPSIMSRVFPDSVRNGLDSTNVEGSADVAYAIPNFHVEYVRHEVGVPVGFWRSVGDSQNGFITESFIDELAHAAHKDPYEFRKALLAKAPRQQGVLNLAAEKAGWGTPLPAGRFRGIAMVDSYASHVAEVAEISIGADQSVKVHRVVCAVDCGSVVNPLTVEAQMQSAIVYGLTAALYGEITISKGRVTQGNFDSYRMLRMSEMPVIEVHIVPSAEAPGGVGEPGLPPIAPAVANAVFAATGKRFRTLPIRLTVA
jgi:isoquinoline 1-oxidoreductase beta subunit